MFDFIHFEQKQAAVALADTLDHKLAADRLGISASELKARVEALEAQLCLLLFETQEAKPVLTEDGVYLIEIFREGLARYRGRG